MRRHFGRFWTLTLLALAMAFGLGQQAICATLTLTCNPMTGGTVNSVYTFDAVWQDDEGMWPSVGDAPETLPFGMLWLMGISNGTADFPGIPMFYVDGIPAFGARYRTYVSAGLNMSDLYLPSNQKQWPNCPSLDPADADPPYEYLTGVPDPADADSYWPQPDLDKYPDPIGMGYPNTLLYGPMRGGLKRPIWYAPAMTSGHVINAWVAANLFKPATEEGGDPTITPVSTDTAPIHPVVSQSDFPWPYYDATGMHFSPVDWGGSLYPNIWLWTYPTELDADPLDTEPILKQNQATPDDGSSSHEYIFRVYYESALPPKSWGATGTGVVLYLALANTNDYQAYPMYLESGTANNGIYVSRVTTIDAPIYINGTADFPGPDFLYVPQRWAYTSLPIGTYHYFFGAAADSLRFLNDAGAPYVLSMQPVPSEWGVGPDPIVMQDSIGLDPTFSRGVTGFPEIDRPAHRSYSDDLAGIEKDTTLYVDREVRAPGLFEPPSGMTPYLFKCSEHPRVSLELTVPKRDEMLVSYYDLGKYGSGRFYGTLWPFKRAINPLMPGALKDGFDMSLRAEASGARVGDDVEFRIMYRQIDGKRPTRIQVFINNANTRSKVPGSADIIGGVPTDQNAVYGYTGHAMIPDNTNGDFRAGVWYRYRTKLPAGPHTYYFEAEDGEQVCVWPRRPDYYTHTATGVSYADAWVPTMSKMPVSQADYATYDDNDYCPGPYINSQCILSDYSVTPTSGKMGQNFRFRVKYSDPDGQRPYSTQVYVQTSDGAVPRALNMVQETPLNPTVDNRAAYQQGIYYVADTSTMEDLALQPGTRRYYFSFTDDWGRQADVNDRIQGEVTNVTSKLVGGRWVPEEQWKEGPTVNGPMAPTLTEAKVESADGTKNSATLWKFSVKYLDQNNDAPQTMKIFIGQKQPDGKTILWDEGHPMTPNDPSDVVYTDGAYFHYVTRLVGKVFPDDSDKQYFYAFLAYDGTTWAVWNQTADPKDALNSDSASMYAFKPLVATADPTVFTMPVPAPYASEEVPVLGPLPVSLPVTMGELADAQLYYSPNPPGVVNGLPDLGSVPPQMVEDEKSGWTGETRYCVMKGNATTVDRVPSVDYVVPDAAQNIGHVDGVYTSVLDLMSAAEGVPGIVNYYDGSQLEEGMWGTVDVNDRTGSTIIPDNQQRWRIYEVKGVFTDATEATPIGVDPIINSKGQIKITNLPADKQIPGTKLWIKYTRTAYYAGLPVIWLTTPLPDSEKGKTVYIRYHDMRFTHIVRGEATNSVGGNGRTHFYADGAGTASVNVKDNDIDPFNGIIGIWHDKARTSENFLNPFVTRLTGNPTLVPLTQEAPSGAAEMYARYYENGEFKIDRWNRQVLLKNLPAGNLPYATYLFGRSMADQYGVIKIGANTAPFLSQGNVTPLAGSRTTSYVYSVIYKDTDGPTGQAPEYVRVYIDGVARDMTPVGNGGTPVYKEGTLYSYTADGLSGNSHKYHFDASDGASIVWFDKVNVDAAAADPTDPMANGHRYDEGVDDQGRSKNTLPTDPKKPIIDIDGPWVNNSPTLTNGLATPNPANATISTSDSVDYTVVYTDLDNDAPFTYDASIDGVGAADIIGAPRVWIDGGANDDTYLAKVAALGPDPLEPTKKRLITAVTPAGGNPGWTANMFAGSLMQITTGPNKGRVLLIQSNTADTLSIATDDLGPELASYLDGTGAVVIEIGFRINGLVMSKLNAEDQDFTKGVTYRITVPRLAVGDHRFHFTARSRVTKPEWYLPAVLPYSPPARFPTSGESYGPNVRSAPPLNNVAPVLSSNDILSGPFVKAVSLVSATKVRLDTASNWTAPEIGLVRQVEGVYLNATLGSNANFDVTNYLTTPALAPLPGNQVTLTATTAGAISAGMDLVQLGTPDGTSLLSVVPDSADSIASINGVYLNAALTGTNYAGAKVGGKITLATPLPSGTTRVYISYKLAGTTPPVYVKYFRVTPATFLSGDPITFRLSYLDADNDPPTYHGGVQGYCKVLFNGVGAARFMVPIATPIDYRTAPVPLYVSITDAPEGTNKYHFEGSDGYDPQHMVRFPAAAGGDPTAGDYPIKVNYKPVLTLGKVEPAAGLPATEYTFSVDYRDGDSTTQSPEVKVRLTKVDGTPQEIFFTLATPAGGTVAAGKTCTLKIPSGTLAAGRYKVAFESGDGLQAATPFTTPDLVVRLANNAPAIVDTSVVPIAGKTSRTFVYQAHFRDPDGDPPAVVVNGVRSEGLKLVIDKGVVGKERTVLMTKAQSEGATPDYSAAGGVLFETAPGIGGATLGAGTHTYEVSATDGTLAAPAVTVGNAPIILMPLFEQIRAVSASAIDPTVAPAVTSGVVGDKVLVVGLIKFPKNAITGAPSSGDSVIIKVTKPDGQTLSLTAHVTMLTDEENTDPINWIGRIAIANYPMGVDPALVTGQNLTLSASGEWKFSASRAGDTQWDAAETDIVIDGRNDIFKMIVGGPMRTVAVKDPMSPVSSTPLVDMLTPAMVIADGDVGRIFGFDWVQQMQIVRWDPLSKTYFRYGSGTFPLLAPGDAVWLKPKMSYPAESVSQADIDSGLLASGNLGVLLDAARQYRLIHTFSKAYPTLPGSSQLAPCSVVLHAGWNQFGNIFFNWKKDSNGQPLLPRQDVGIPFSSVRVKYLNQELSLSDAMLAGWIRDYAWRFDADTRQYVLVSASASGAERVLKAWSGYWIRTFVDCELIINPVTTYNGGALSTNSVSTESSEKKNFDTPPPAP